MLSGLGYFLSPSGLGDGGSLAQHAAEGGRQERVFGSKAAARKGAAF